jgi:hypothetical protein
MQIHMDSSFHTTKGQRQMIWETAKSLRTSITYEKRARFARNFLLIRKLYAIVGPKSYANQAPLALSSPASSGDLRLWTWKCIQIGRSRSIKLDRRRRVDFSR